MQVFKELYVIQGVLKALKVKGKSFENIVIIANNFGFLKTPNALMLIGVDDRRGYAFDMELLLIVFPLC